MMEKYPVLMEDGSSPPPIWREFKVVGMIGPYQVWGPSLVGLGSMVIVLCPPEMRKPKCWNATRFFITDDNNLEPEDDHVELDPYHMCLLYELHQEVTRDV